MKNIILIALTAASVVGCTSKEVASNRAERQVAEEPSNEAARKYFIVQNVATEKTRVYLKCEEDSNHNCLPGTKNTMVFETEMVVGGKDMRTNVGVQNIEYWTKFKDTPGVYPSWYDPTYPPVPNPGKGFKRWFDADVMPDGKKSASNGGKKMRGAFGWYTTKMTPSDSGQWMHGTVGWGSDEDKFINFAHGGGLAGTIANIFADMRSHGCTRHENRAIAYLQSFLPAGTALIKIYAKEELKDASLARYESLPATKTWNYILTKEDVREINPKSSTAEEVQTRGVSEDMILERGSYTVNMRPQVQNITGKGAKSGRSGDSYKLFRNEGPYGAFYVDEGTITPDYRHPAGVKYEGISDFSATLVPNYMK